jgi:molybdate transport system substrate-binding protein
MPIRPLRIAVLFFALFPSNNVAANDDVLIFAAASTTVALQQGIRRYHEIGEDRVRVSFASSGALARQLDNGAPASLYLSANVRWMDWTEKRNLLAPGTRTDLMGNRLVLIEPDVGIPDPGHRDLRAWLGDLGENRLAIGDPGHVPAGAYARSAMTSLGLWRDLADRTVRAANVRAALLLVERQEAAFGIVYRTDALGSKAVRIVAAFPADSHPPILYGLAMIRGRDQPAARRFYGFLKSAEAGGIFRSLGFSAP